MSKFDTKLQKAIAEEVGLSEPPNMEDMANDLLNIASQLEDTIKRCKQDMEAAEDQLHEIVEQLNVKLGWEIRKRQPKMQITHKDGACNAGYFTQNLHVRPDLQNKQWEVGGPLAKKFSMENPEAVALSSDPSNMADAIVKFFKNRFRTLN